MHLLRQLQQRRGHNAKNKLTTNYLYLAEKLGGQVHDLNEVYDLVPLDGGGFEVRTRHPGWAKRAAHRRHHSYTAEQVIVAAHAYGSSKLLHHMLHRPSLVEQRGGGGQLAGEQERAHPPVKRHRKLGHRAHLPYQRYITPRKQLPVLVVPQVRGGDAG